MLRVGSILTLLLCAAPLRSAAQGLELWRGDAADLALAGAGCTATSGPSALFVNPARLAGAGWAVTASMELAQQERVVERRGPQINAPLPTARDLAGVQLLPAAAFSFPLGLAGLTGAAGYRSGLALESNYRLGPDGPLRYLGQQQRLRQHLFVVGLALDGGWFSVGLALELSHLRVSGSRTLWAGLPDDADRLQDPALDLRARFAGHDLLAAGGTLALRVHPWPWVELALAVRPPMHTTVEGDLSLEPDSSAPEAPRGYSSVSTEAAEGRLDLHLPLSVRVGLALRWRGGALHLELRQNRWGDSQPSALQTPDAAVILEGTGGSEPRPLQQIPWGANLGHHTSLHLGLSSPPLAGLLTLRAGYAYHLGASRSAQPAPTALDPSQHQLALGLLAHRGPLHIGLALQHSLSATLRSEGEQTPLVNPLAPEVTESTGAGRYQASATRVLLQLGVDWR